MGKRVFAGAMSTGACLALIWPLATGCSERITSNENGVVQPGGAIPANSSPEWPGYTRVPGMDPYCSTAIAADPAEYDQSMSWIPCVDGQKDCEALRWDGALLQSAEVGAIPIGEQGTVRGAIVIPNNPNASARAEQVALDFAGDATKARFALRTLGFTVDGAGTRLPLNYRYGERINCNAHLFAASSGIWLTATTAAAGLQLLWFANGQSEPTQRWELGDPGFGATASSDTVFAATRSDGQLYVIDRVSGNLTTTYGPGRRLWPRQVIDQRVLLSTKLSPRVTSLDFEEEEAFIYEDGAFTELAVKGYSIQTNGTELIWLTAQKTGVFGNRFVFTLWAAPWGTDATTVAAGTRKVREIPYELSGLDPVRTSDKAVAMSVYLPESTLVTVDLATGMFSSRAWVPPRDPFSVLQALTDSHAWYSGDDRTQRYSFPPPSGPTSPAVEAANGAYEAWFAASTNLCVTVHQCYNNSGISSNFCTAPRSSDGARVRFNVLSPAQATCWQAFTSEELALLAARFRCSTTADIETDRCYTSCPEDCTGTWEDYTIKCLDPRTNMLTSRLLACFDAR